MASRSAAPRRGRTRRSAEPAPGRLWRAGWVLPVAGAALRDGAVAVRDGCIADVGAAETLAARHPDLEREDLGPRILMPGLVDAHCHLEWSLLDGLLAPDAFGPWLGRMLRLRMRMTAEDHVTAARFGALRALTAGTTTVTDSGPTGAGAAALAESGQRGLVHLEAFGREEGDAARAAADAVAEQVAALDPAIGARGRIGVSPHAPYTVGPAFWAALRAHPGLAGRPWATHLAESSEEEEVVSSGGGALGRVFAEGGFAPGRWDGPEGSGVVPRVAAADALAAGLVAAHCVRLGRGDAATLAAAGVGVAHCPRSNAYLRCGRAPLEQLAAAGVAVGLGTDSPASGGDYDLRAEARACRDLHSGARELSPPELLRLITLGAAEALGMDRDVGAITPGRRADLIAVSAPPGAGEAPEAWALDARAAVDLVMVDGEVLLRDAVPLRVDAEPIHRAAAEARAHLC